MSDIRRALALLDSKQYTAALPLLQTALHLSELKPDGPSSAETAEILVKIGECSWERRDFRAAAEHYRRAAAISNYSFEKRIRASLDAAKSHYSMGDFTEAEQQVNTSLSIIDAEAVARTAAPAMLKGHRADALTLYVMNLNDSGRYSEALPQYEEIVAYYESVGDAENLISCLAGLGEVYAR